jgi:hypothetical protein
LAQDLMADSGRAERPDLVVPVAKTSPASWHQRRSL